MAQVNELGVGRFNRLLQKLLEIKGGPPSPVLAPDIMAVLELGSMPPEWRFLAGERLGWGFGNVSSAAGTNGYVQIANPADSGVLLVLEACVVSSSGTTASAIQLHSFSAISTAAVVANSSVQRDGRGAGGAGNFLTAQVRQGGSSAADIASVGNAVMRITMAINGAPAPIPLNQILEPGQAFTWIEQTAVATAAIAVCWILRERGIESSETRRNP